MFAGKCWLSIKLLLSAALLVTVMACKPSPSPEPDPKRPQPPEVPRPQSD